MAKKNKTKVEEVVENTNTPEVTDNTKESEEVETKVEEVIEKVEEVETKVEEVENVKEVKVSNSFKDIFEKAIETTPYMLFQNGMLICRWKPNVSIECQEDGFVLNHVKYTYSGIEVKHI